MIWQGSREVELSVTWYTVGGLFETGSLRGERSTLSKQRTYIAPRSGLAGYFMSNFGVYPYMHACSEIYDRHLQYIPITLTVTAVPFIRLKAILAKDDILASSGEWLVTEQGVDLSGLFVLPSCE